MMREQNFRAGAMIEGAFQQGAPAEVGYIPLFVRRSTQNSSEEQEE
jgi:hypothetical protein